MKKRPWKFGDPIPRTSCPECDAMIIYNGNYFCSECKWALPHPIELIRDQKTYQQAITQLFLLMGEKPPTLNQLESTE